ncbi:AMP-binding protein [Bradyrhizobium sp. LHD-71]|uniref:AMP-binding protein n=1 Tax=Bradyrhizobium sp. LHD-71 TaxID=3072141 RepID=UPI002810139C|nr:AMP-binding protein [Bradyrhizobium sp. LHD-71]MDQ8729468.1 AMP-binding protein [Bradyrhizobium sp. LHD-71]
MNIATWLERAGLSHPDRPAIGYGTRVARSYGELSGRAGRLAGALRAQCGLSPGERVAIFAKNSPDYMEALYAIWHAGLAAVPVNAKLHGRELAYILEQSGARVCFVSKDLETAAAAHAPATLQRLITIGSREHEQLFAADRVAVAARSDDDLAWLFYTSGTTGRPKGAMLTHKVLAWASHAYLGEVDQTVAGDAVLHAAPMSHGSGMYIMPHVARLGINVIPESGAFEPDEIFELVRRWPRTSMFAAPTMIKRLTESAADCDPANIRTIIWGGAPMYVEDAVRALDRFGPRFAQIYGQGEAPMTITTLTKEDIADRNDPRWAERLGSAGRPYACVEVMVADGEGRPLPVGETGEICARGDVVMPGYWQNPDATAKALQNGWLLTGDVGAFDAQGYLTLKDRSKDVIISGGSNVYPREVEEVLLKHDRVREVSVIGRPDTEWGEIVVAYVVGDVGAEDLDRLCLDEIARFKRPKDYVFVEQLPKNNYGKILKTELREKDTRRA